MRPNRIIGQAQEAMNALKGESWPTGEEAVGAVLDAMRQSPLLADALEGGRVSTAEMNGAVDVWVGAHQVGVVRQSGGAWVYEQYSIPRYAALRELMDEADTRLSAEVGTIPRHERPVTMEWR